MSLLFEYDCVDRPILSNIVIYVFPCMSYGYIALWQYTFQTESDFIEELNFIGDEE